MHRFRKRSDAKRSQPPSPLRDQNLDAPDALPELPPTNDFRTSLILPDLSRRFSLLRSSTGDPVSLDLLRTRLADQRARGDQNHITEEEEDMLLETLGRLRSRNAPSPNAHQEQVVRVEDGTRNSVQTTGTSSSTSSPSARSTKRYSNNLFGSGRLRAEHNYLRSIASTKGSSSSTRTVSLTPTEASVATTREVSTASLRPVTPESINLPSSTPSSPDEKDVKPSTPPVPPAPPISLDTGTNQIISVAEYRLQKTLGPAVLKRASLALEQAIKEIEDEVEDEILLPRSAPIPRGSPDQPKPEVRNSDASSTSAFEPGMAISIDQTIHHEFSERRQSPIPTRIIPGYVPGMPRPMTPRDLEIDEQRSHSTTPRAQSPLYETQSSPSPINSSLTKVRRESNSTVSRPSAITSATAAPLFLQRSTNGRFTPDDGFRASDGDSNNLENSLSSILGRRRPASPLSGPPYQPVGTNSTNRPSSRPTTPSNVIWTPNPNHRSNPSGHNKNNSWTAALDGGISSNLDYDGSAGGHHKIPSRSMKSPALPDSPTLDFALGNPFSFSSGSPPSFDQTALSSEQPHAYLPAVDPGSPLTGVRPPRSITPTQAAQWSPVSPTFSAFDLSPKTGSRRSSRQNAPSSPFNSNHFPSLGLGQRANSSRSSFDSAGSSFHSWDEPDKVLSLFSDLKEPQPAWHEFDRSQTSSVTPGDSPDDEEWNPEEIIQRYAGLKKSDIAIIQEKLVAAAFTKIANTDPRDRAPSSLRRRRPSTSQSNYSRIASPPPRPQTPASPSPYVVDDQYLKASALLNSVVDSIKEQPVALDTTAAVKISSAEDKDISPSTRRNRDLAHVLFGTEDENKEDTPKEMKYEQQSVITVPDTPITSTTPTSPVILPVPSVPPTPSLVSDSQSTTPFASPYLLLRNPSAPRIPQTPREQAELAREVQQKTEAAMIALNKDPSRTNLGDSLKHTTSVRRRVDASKISTPTLVSTTTSVETIPIRTPSLSSNNNSSTSKIGSRFKRLRGSLRAKNLVSSGEETATPETLKSPPASQMAYYDPAKLNPPGAPKLSSATEAGRFKVPIPSPPASAGPGLKGFMARFRNKQRMSEMPGASETSVPRATSPLVSPISPQTTLRNEPATPKAAMLFTDSGQNIMPRPTSQQRPMYSRFPPANPTPAPTSSPATQASTTGNLNAQSADALEQLFRAANDLGLDENALNDLLARSGPTLSRNPLLKKTTSDASPAPADWKISDNAQQVSYIGSSGSDQTATPASYVKPPHEPHLKGSVSDSQEGIVTRKPSARKVDHLRRPKEGQSDNAANAIVRRTIIYANDNLSSADLSSLVQRKNSTRRKRVSAQSLSNRSVHDRVPTPPPPKPPGKRFSADGLPPMPQLPNFLGQADKLLNVPSTSATGSIEKSNSTYDSLYDMYAEESRAASADLNPSVEQPVASSEPGPALEVIELANGETIWNIVNGLRDADDESIYSGRTSFASEYSSREPGNDGVQTFLKEHARSGSKGSVTSLASKRKLPQGKMRPETKIFYSSSAQIGRLIESLSQGADAGSFNFLPNLTSRGPGHSTSSSLSTNDINWTVEERLDRMLGQMNAS